MAWEPQAHSPATAPLRSGGAAASVAAGAKAEYDFEGGIRALGSIPSDPKP